MFQPHSSNSRADLLEYINCSPRASCSGVRRRFFAFGFRSSSSSVFGASLLDARLSSSSDSSSSQAISAVNRDLGGELSSGSASCSSSSSVSSPSFLLKPSSSPCAFRFFPDTFSSSKVTVLA
ncbi:unnamed protein product [Haemonchus placei]|uniref:Uncharacterized protein n=1 Tax=Haemonchus placei TaxID=6290 RepID=A0A3P7VM11_HAEPC|nr:unnamed protein product [Haemonchus placei]